MLAAPLRAKSSSLLGTNEDDLLVHDRAYKHINGGPGVDTLLVPAGTTLDLSGHSVFGVEILDLNGGDSTVTLNAQEVMRLTSAAHTMQITGIASDAVHAGDGWIYVGISGDVAIYENGQATLIVDRDVRRSGIVDPLQMRRLPRA